MTIETWSDEALLDDGGQLHPRDLAEEVVRLRGELRDEKARCTSILDRAERAEVQRDALKARAEAAEAELKIAWHDCQNGDCNACPKCCDALASQVATLREALEDIEFEGDDGAGSWRDNLALFKRVTDLLTDTSKAAAEHDKRIRRETLEVAEQLRESGFSLEQRDAAVRKAALEEAASVAEAHCWCEHQPCLHRAADIRALAAKKEPKP